MTSRLLPNWLEAYMAYTAESRSPDEFHLWTGIVTIAGAIRRKAWFNFDYFELFPNLYVVLVAPAGRCKKSTAMRIGRKLLAQVPGVNFTTDSTTRERLIVDLAAAHADGHSSMTAYASEFGSLLTSSGMDMVTFLTDIYDCPTEWAHKTKMGGTNKIKAPWLNLYGGTTPDWIARALPLDTVGIGLTSRIIFIYQDTPRVRKAFPKLSDAQKKLGELLLKDLVTISLISGQYILGPDAEEFYEAWDLKNQTERMIDDPRLSGYYERKPMHIIKLSMTLAAAERDETVLRKDDIEKAIELLDRIEPAMARTFSAVGKNPLTLDIEQALVAITISGEEGISYGELLNRFKHSVRKDELDEVLNTLQLIGAIKAVANEKGVRYYRVL